MRRANKQQPPVSRPPLHPAMIPNLCLIFLLATPNSTVPQSILDDLLELALISTYEERPPLSLRAWLQRVAVIEPVQQAAKIVSDIQTQIETICAEGLDGMHTWWNSIKTLCPWSEDDESTTNSNPLHRNSPYALYLRRSRMAFFKLPFEQAVNWWMEVQSWCDGSWVGPDNRSGRDQAAAKYSKAKTAQDYQGMKDATRYYDLDDGTPLQTTRPQFALLNTAFLEFEIGGWKTCREALSEAIQVARHVGDARCLVACSSLSKRLDFAAPPPEDGIAIATGLAVADGRPTPTDVLWEIKRATSLGHPLRPLFTNLSSARTLFQSPPTTAIAKEKGRATSWNDRAWESAWHTTAAILWSEVGSSTLSELRQSMALNAFDHTVNQWNVRQAVLSRRAAKCAQSNRIDDALRILFEAVETREERHAMGVLELRAWKLAVWDVVRTGAERQGQKHIVEHIDRISPPPVPHWSNVRGGTETDAKDAEVVSLLDQGLKLLEAGQPPPALSLFLQALHRATVTSFGPLRLRCICHVVEARLALSPTTAEAARSLLELESVWGEVLGCGREDPELLARARETRARAMMVRAGEEDAELVPVVLLLRQAFETYSTQSNYRACLRTLTLLGRLYDHLSTSLVPPPSTIASWIILRDGIADEYAACKRSNRGGGGEGGEWTQVWEVEGIVAGVEKAVLTDIAIAG